MKEVKVLDLQLQEATKQYNDIKKQIDDRIDTIKKELTKYNITQQEINNRLSKVEL